MKTLYDLGIEIAKIREAINTLEVKGEKNAALVVFACRKCNEIIEAINTTAKQHDSGQNGENQTEGGEINGEQDSGTAE